MQCALSLSERMYQVAFGMPDQYQATSTLTWSALLDDWNSYGRPNYGL